jgi:hypothetical protein
MIGAHETGIPEVNFGRHVAFAMLLVVASFSATLAVSQWRLQPIEALALDIAHDAAPSIEHLSTVRTDLIRLGMYVNEYLTRTDNGGTTSREDIYAVRRLFLLRWKKRSNSTELNSTLRFSTKPQRTRSRKATRPPLGMRD